MATNSRPAQPDPEPLLSTGIEGLDRILEGGLTPNRLYLVEGVPGAGKTTLALQFLLEGVRLGETVLCVTLSETEEELKSVGASHGWSLDKVLTLEMIPSEESLLPDQQYTVFHPSEVELSATTKRILAEVERLKPTRVVFDALTQLRLLAGNQLHYRRQILALKQFLHTHGCTVLVLDDVTSLDHDPQIQSISHGVLTLERLSPQFGAERRRLQVSKFRGRKYQGGYHDFIIQRGGLVVFPRLIVGARKEPAEPRRLSSGVAAMDALLGGGIDRGSSTLIIGASGTGKSTLAAQLVAAAAGRGEAAAMFVFSENLNTLLTRCNGLGIQLRKHADAGTVTLQQVDPAELSPGEFAQAIRSFAERPNATIVVIDSLNGYLNAMPEERFLVVQLHELLSYLGNRGVATLLVGANQGLIGGPLSAPVDVSYLADAVILLRYFENRGELRQAISVVKNRGGAHERTIREYRLERGGISLGEPLREFRGVLSGMPSEEGEMGPPRV
jgi:circadian clock protein KaiC